MQSPTLDALNDLDFTIFFRASSGSLEYSVDESFDLYKAFVASDPAVMEMLYQRLRVKGFYKNESEGDVKHSIWMTGDKILTRDLFRKLRKRIAKSMTATAMRTLPRI